MSINEHNDLQSIKLKPIISYPREALVGKSYVMSIDVELAMPETPWPYSEEEYAISFILETRPFFSYEPFGGHEPSIVLHRFGGTYGPAEYLLTAATEEIPKGTIGITFVNGWGIPIAHMELECEVKQEVKLDPQRELTITRKNRSLTPQTAPRGEERQSALIPEIETVSATESIMREAREHIERQLREAGWLLEDYASLNASPGQSIAVRNFTGLPDGYLLIVNGEQAGVIKVRQTGEPLAGIEEPVLPLPLSSTIQSQVHQTALSPRSVLPFVYESTGIETRFTSYLDPEPRSRRVFIFHRPETLALWLSQAPPSAPATSNDVLRARLRRMPPVQGTGLYNHQVEAITALERSFAGNRPRALIQMATGSGKTYMVVSSLYRLLKYGGVQRVLYLVDRSELAHQASAAFAAYAPPGDESKFTDLYHVQLLQDNKLDPTARVCISTVQRLDSMLAPQLKIDRIVQEESFLGQEDLGEDGKPREVTYNPDIPIEYFDIIVIDECHRSIYGTWRPLLEYFDAFLVGLTATPENRTFAFFGRNLVYERSLEESGSSQENRIVQRLWDYCNVLRDDGMSYSDYVEQLTYLLFLKMADERTKPSYNERSRLPAGYDWRSLLDKRGDELETHYRRILQKYSSEQGMLGVIFGKALNKIQDPANLYRMIVDLIDNETWTVLNTDIIGDAYEGLLEKSAEDRKTGMGQYFTPRPLIQAIVDVTHPEPDQRICDPACGTGGFLIAAHNYIAEHYELTREEAKDLKNHTLHGWERSNSAARLCAMNLFLHGIGDLNDTYCPIEIGDGLLALPLQTFDLVLSNPPFGRRIAESYRREPMGQQDFWTETRDGDLLYIQRAYSLLRTHGRAAIVVPDGVFFKSGPGEIIRRRLLEDCDLHTILRLPENLFYYTGIPTNVVFFDRKPPSSQPWTKQVWIYDLRTNRKFNPRRNPITRADFDDFVAAYNSKNRSERRESERFRAFSYEELIQRERINLNFSWLQEQK